MAAKADFWESKLEDRMNTICRALVRMGIMTHVQIARLLDINSGTEQRIIHQKWDVFEEQLRISKQLKRGRYPIANRTTKFVRLSDDALTKWAEKEGIMHARNRVRSVLQAQTLKVGDVFVEMYRDGLLYDNWDITPTRGEGKGLHAQLIKNRADGKEKFKLGLFILPTQLNPIEESQKGHVFGGMVQKIGGLVQRATQAGETAHTLFLAPQKYYATVLNSLAKLEKQGCRFYLLPYESFLEHPRWYLKSIATDEELQASALFEHVKWDDKLNVPAEYDFKRLVQAGGRWRFIDVYVNGSVDRIRNWAGFTMGYSVPGTGSVAGSDVYVFDETMRLALQNVLRMKKRGSKLTNKVQVLPWPEHMLMPESPDNQASNSLNHEEPADMNTSVDIDDDWLNYFNV